MVKRKPDIVYVELCKGKYDQLVMKPRIPTSILGIMQEILARLQGAHASDDGQGLEGNTV